MNVKTPTEPPSPPSVVDVSQAPAMFNPPTLEVFERYSSDLVAFEYDDYDKAGKPITKRWPLETIGSSTKLIPEAHCRAIERELEDALIPAGFDVGKELARRVTGRTRKRDLNDPEIFVAEMTRVFVEAPADIGDMAADSLLLCKYPAEVCDAAAAVMPLVEDRRRWLRQVRLHLAEYERRASKEAGTSELPKQIQRFKSLGPDIKEAVGEVLFQIFWDTLWLVLDDGTRMVLAQPTRWLRDVTAPHVAAIGKVANRVVELVIRQKPATGSCK